MTLRETALRARSCGAPCPVGCALRRRRAKPAEKRWSVLWC